MFVKEMKCFNCLISFWSLWICHPSYSQIILPHPHAFVYPQIEVSHDLAYANLLNRDTFLVESEYYAFTNDLTHKVGRLTEYYPDGSIKRIGYWNKVNDTFCIDSQHIIVFVNPHPHLTLIQGVKRVVDSSNHNIYQNSYNIITEPSHWQMAYDEKGKILMECIEEDHASILLTYSQEKILYERYIQNKKTDTWSVKRE